LFVILRVQNWTFEPGLDHWDRDPLQVLPGLGRQSPASPPSRIRAYAPFLDTYFEMMGVLYKRGHASLDLLDDLFAGSVLISWRKLAPVIHGYRQRARTPDYAQWFEHLAQALDARLTGLGEVHPTLNRTAPTASPPGAEPGSD
jgi:hypothetical protein